MSLVDYKSEALILELGGEGRGGGGGGGNGEKKKQGKKLGKKVELGESNLGLQAWKTTTLTIKP